MADEKTVLLSINESDAESAIAKSVVSREAEIFAYEMNIAVYNAMLEDPNLARDAREHITATLKTERAERDKVSLMCQALKALIIPSRLNAAVALAKSELQNV